MNMANIIINIDGNIKHQFKMYCLKNNLSMKYVLTEYILKILSCNNRRKLKQNPKGEK